MSACKSFSFFLTSITMTSTISEAMKRLRDSIDGDFSTPRADFQAPSDKVRSVPAQGTLTLCLQGDPKRLSSVRRGSLGNWGLSVKELKGHKLFLTSYFSIYLSSVTLYTLPSELRAVPGKKQRIILRKGLGATQVSTKMMLLGSSLTPFVSLPPSQVDHSNCRSQYQLRPSLLINGSWAMGLSYKHSCCLYSIDLGELSLVAK